MKRLFLLFSFLSVFFFSCKNIEKQANEIIQNFSNSIENINGLETISSYDLNSKIESELLKLEENKKSAIENLSKKEDRDMFNSMFNLVEIDAFIKIRKVLSDKTAKTINEIKGKMWIESESKNPNSIFIISETEIGFLNLSNSFDFKILNGSIFSDSYSLFFDLNNNNLIVSSKEGAHKKYELADENHIIMGKWKNENTYGGQYNGSGIILEKDGKGIEYGYEWEKIAYNLSGNIIYVTKHSKYSGENVENFSKRSNNKIQHEFGAMFSRVKNNGPNNINYLYEGDFNNPSKKFTIVETSFTTKETTSDCDKFIKDYEVFVDSYIKILKKYKKNPTDASILTEYSDVMQKATTMQTNAANCTDAKYSAKLLELATKMTKAATSLQ
jgi:hypothetical protein